MTRLGLILCLTVPVLAACAAVPKPTHVTLPAAFESGNLRVSTATPEVLDQWWRLYEDQDLTDLVEQALANAPDARLAAARLAAAKAIRSGALSAFNPQGAVRGNLNRTETDQISGGSPLLPQSGETKTAAGEFQVSWEIDLFGRRYFTRKVAKADLAAARFNAEAARAALAANVAEGAFQVRGLGIQRADAIETVRIQSDLFNMAQLRASRGFGSDYDTDRAAADLAQSKAELERLTADFQAAKRSLLTLLGRGPDPIASLILTEALGPVPAVPSSLPSDLLKRRPDVREAQARLTGALGAVTLSKLAFFPTFTLLPGAGWSDSQSKIYGSTVSFWSMGGGVSVPILDQPRLISQLGVQKARATQAVIGFEKTVQGAFAETENTLVRLAADQKRLELLTDAEARAHKASDAAVLSYKAGLIPMGTALEAERNWRATRSAMTGAKIAALQRSVQAFKALGGGWSADLTKRTSK
jgi:NodT family efflux transporter outer membrane factor (OMF) lipoprotein